MCAVAVHNIMKDVLIKNNVPEGVINLVVAGSEEKILGDDFLKDKRIPLISVTGSVAVGRRVAKLVGERLGKTILELGGNNAIIVSQYGNKNMALPWKFVWCHCYCRTTMHINPTHLLIHDCMYDIFKDKLIAAYKQVTIGHPLDEKKYDNLPR